MFLFCLHAVNGRRVRARHGNARQRLSLHHVQHLLQTHFMLLDFVRLQRSNGFALFRPERHRSVQSRRWLAIPECGRHISVHVDEIAAVARPRTMPGFGEQTIGSAQNHFGPGRSRQNLLSQGELMFYVL